MFINLTETVGVIMTTGTQTTTGSFILSLFFVILVFFAMSLLFGIKMEFTAIIVLPLILSYAAYYNEWVGGLAVVIIYLAFIFTQKFIFK